MNLELNYEGFESYLVSKWNDVIMEGVHYLFRFENDYGASVIKHKGSYGHHKDLWELAVIFFETENSWDLTYNTPITNDVIGHLTDEEVRDLLRRIKEL